MNKIAACLFSVFVLFTTYSCKKDGIAGIDPTLSPVVTVKDKTLYKAELDEALPLGLSAEDSIATAKAYIDMWINDQLMYNKAQQNIHNESEIEEMVENYRKSLILNTYQGRLLKEHFSKFVSDSELKSYYEQNKDNFKLEDNIIKGLFLKVPIDSKELNNFRKWYVQGTEAAVENIEKNTLRNAVGYEYFYDKWIDLEDVLSNMPKAVTDERIFLQRNKNLELRDSSFVYLLNIKEYELAGNNAPYDYIKGQLSEIYIEQQKGQYMEQLKKDLYEKALAEKEIKFYNE
ncbi:peptidyl-prolyl cis-trans isomerase [Prevotella sp. 10(H)]|uniref:peptidylprolyl isomerase n=1 Tax=Prevotella sp. 10(H) TaxID=1158294 RepID=UPI0004A6AAD2|nr:peptidylprolyl isomerase [Prevotella sp. 10(H)]